MRRHPSCVPGRSGSTGAPRRFFDRPLPAWLVFGGLIGIGCTTPQRSITIANRSTENLRVVIDNPERDGLDATRRGDPRRRR